MAPRNPFAGTSLQLLLQHRPLLDPQLCNGLHKRFEVRVRDPGKSSILNYSVRSHDEHRGE